MAEKAIQTFKDHFVGVLSGCAPSMPIHLWCQLLPQVKQQLLLLRQSCAHPNLSAYAHVNEHQDYNRHLFVPIGMEALVHNKPHKRHTYVEHCTKAFVLGTSTEHYQCWKFWTQHAPRASLGQIFQAQILNQPIGHAGGSSNCGSSMPYGHSLRHRVSTTTHLYPPSTW